MLKELGHRIYYYFGLAGFFQQLFALSEDPPKSFIMNWILEGFDIPWQWTYSKESDLFLCDQFPYSLNLSGWEKLLAEGRIHRQTAGLPSQAQAALLLCQQELEPENLKHSNHEIDQIQKILTDRQIESVISSPSPDDLTKNILKLKEENKRLRIIHYAGHIQQEILNVRSDDHLAPGFLQEACGLTLDSAPLVFLNGCHTGSGGKTEPQPQRLALEFLDCGAAACVVTQFKITDLSAEKFAGYFYQHFIEQGFDAASSLHHARRDLKKYIAKYSESDFDISAYFYNLLGRPEIIF